MTKNNLSRRFSATLLMVGICFIILFSAGLASAWEWDNVRSYDPITKEVTIKNRFGLPLIGGDIAKVKLNTPLDYHVAWGYGLVYEFTIDSYTDYENALKQTDLYNAADMSVVERKLDYKVKGTEVIVVDEYENVCDESLRLKGEKFYCEDVWVGNHEEERVVWSEFTGKDIVKGKITIGVFTDVKPNDRIEWVPTFFGEKITEWAIWTADLNVGLMVFYKFDDSVTDATANGNDAVNQGTVNGTAKLGNGSRFFDGANDWINFTNPAIQITSSDISINMWIFRQANGEAYQQYVGARSGGWNIIHYNTGGNAGKLGWGKAGTDELLSVMASQIALNIWTMVTITYNQTANEINFYYNSTADSNNPYAYSTEMSGSADELFGVNSGMAVFYEGLMDETGIWNRSLSQAEITQLHNNHIGITFSDLSITITFPENTTYNETLTELNYTVMNGLFCWNSVDGGATNSSAVAAGTNFAGLESVPGLNEWIVYCNDSVGEAFDSVIFFVNKSVASNLTAPTNATGFNQGNINFSIDSIPTNTNLTNVTLYIWHDNGTLLLTNFSGLFGGATVETNFTSNLTDGVFLWNAETCADDVDCAFASLNQTFEVHTEPSTIVINSPIGDVDFLAIGNNLTLNWTISEPGQNLTDHITNCSFTYNGVETLLNLTFCIVTNETSFLYVDGVNNLTFEVIEKFGLTTTNITFWNFTALEINQTFVTPTVEGALENFSAVIRLDPARSITAATLIYNNTLVVGTSTVIGDNIELKKTGFSIPQVAADTNLTFLWSILLDDATVVNLTTQTQLATSLQVDNCSNFTKAILNLTLVDEETQIALVNTTIEIAINLLTVDRTSTVVSLSGEFEGDNPLAICMNQNLTSTTSYSMDAIIKYENIGYAIEYYNLVNSPLTNESNIVGITLFDLNSNDSTEFQLTFNGEDFLPVENALIFVERQYIAEDVFKTVELPKTDSNGQTVIHLVRNDVVYNIRVIKDDVVLGTFLNIIAFCQDFTIGQCSINLNALTNESGIFNYDSEVGIVYNSPPIFNSTTNIVSFDFTSTDGTPKIVRLDVERRDIFGNISVCDNTIVSTSGTVLCNIGLNLSDTSLVTKISVNGEEWIGNSVVIDTTGFGNISYVMWFLLAIGLVLMFSESKNGIMLSIMFSFIAAIGLGWSIGGIIGLGSAGIWILVIVVIGIWKINKGRKA